MTAAELGAEGIKTVGALGLLAVACMPWVFAALDAAEAWLIRKVMSR